MSNIAKEAAATAAAEAKAKFDDDVRAAKTSARPFRVEHQVGGASLVHYLSAEEIADAQARTAVEAEEKERRASRTTAEKLAALGLTVEELREALK